MGKLDNNSFIYFTVNKITVWSITNNIFTSNEPTKCIYYYLKHILQRFHFVKIRYSIYMF